MKRLFFGLFATTLCVAAFTQPVKAQPALDPFSPGTIFIGDGPWTLGWDFTPNVDISVSSLGFFDDNADGLIDPHDVGIWNAGTRVLITSTSVTNADPLTGVFRYHDISPVVLTAGTTYSIGATIEAGVDTDPYSFDSAFGIDSRISFNNPNYIHSSGLTYPENKSGISTSAYFGPNFVIGGGPVADVPEPGVIATASILLGSLGAGFIRGRRRKAGIH